MGRATWALAALIAAGPASAHVPHDVIYAVAAPPDLNADQPWLVSVFHTGFLSNDGGFNWDAVGGGSSLIGPTAGGAMPDGTLLLCAYEGVYRSEDGTRWGLAETDGTGRGCVVFGDEVMVPTSKGIERGRPQGPFTVELEGDFSYLRASEPGLAAISAEGDAWSSTGTGTWYNLSHPNDAELLSIVAVPGPPAVFYAGDAAGKVWRFDNAWRPCGSLPPSSHPAVVQITGDAEVVVAAPASLAPYVSFDGCATWESRTVSVPTEWPPISGGATDDEEAYEVLEVSGDRWLVGAWSGLWLSEDQGQSWKQQPVAPPTRCQDLQIAPAYPHNRRIWTSTFGAGVAYTDDGGRTFHAPATGMPYGNAESLAVPPEDPDEVWVVNYNVPWRSTDGGASWVEVEQPYGSVASVTAFAADDIWILSRSTASQTVLSSFAVTEDGGETWTEITGTQDLVSSVGSVTAFETSKGRRYCVASSGGMLHSDDRELWRLTTPIGTDPGRLAARQGVDPDAVLYAASSGGMYLSTDLCETFEEVHHVGPDGFVDVAFAEDGRAFAVTLLGHLFTSEDGRAWTQLAQIPALPSGVFPRPDFADVPQVLVSTMTGPYLVDLIGRDVVVAPFGGLYRVDSANPYAVCTGCTEDSFVATDDASMSEATRLTEGVRVETNLRGHVVRVIGKVDGAGEAALEVDGDVVATFGGTETDGYEVLVEVDGLDDVDHALAIVHVSGDGVLFDAVEAYTEASVLAPPRWREGDDTAVTDTAPPDDTAPTGDSASPDTDGEGGGGGGRCGCATGAAWPVGVGWLALGAIVVTRRRHPHANPEAVC